MVRSVSGFAADARAFAAHARPRTNFKLHLAFQLLFLLVAMFFFGPWDVIMYHWAWWSFSYFQRLLFTVFSIEVFFVLDRKLMKNDSRLVDKNVHFPNWKDVDSNPSIHF